MKLRFIKRTESKTNKMRIPKFIVDKFGRDYYFEYDEEKKEIKLIPISKGE